MAESGVARPCWRLKRHLGFGSSLVAATCWASMNACGGISSIALGASGASGASGAGGASGSSMSSSGTGGEVTFTPVCAGLLALTTGESPSKGLACSDIDPPLCYKTCGPQGIGFKSETCLAGIYVEQAGCSFQEDRDYSCYATRGPISAACPAKPPQAATACAVSACVVCNVDGTYFDSSGATRLGYCVCPPGESRRGHLELCEYVRLALSGGKGC